MNTAILTRIENDQYGNEQYVIRGVGKPAFWPHDGDIVKHNDVSWMKEKKGWHVVFEEDV